MKSLSVPVAAVLWVLMTVIIASAQFIPPGGSQFNPPLPPPPPPPKIEVPTVPRMDATPPAPQVQGLQRGSFGDRIGKCLEDGAAAGLGPNERSTYSRGCANR